MKTIVRERPILFSGPMVRAILEGRKTQTRRVIRPQPHPTHQRLLEEHPGDPQLGIPCPYGAAGDRLWVRETWASIRGLDEKKPSEIASYGDSADLGFFYRSDGDEQVVGRGRWRPSIHMPRWASRITLGILGVRVERVKDIGEEEAVSEGCVVMPASAINPQPTARGSFIMLWNSINYARGFGWLSNPWVWVIEFRRVAA